MTREEQVRRIDEIRDARERLGSAPGAMLDAAVRDGLMVRINWNRWTWSDAVGNDLALRFDEESTADAT